MDLSFSKNHQLLVAVFLYWLVAAAIVSFMALCYLLKIQGIRWHVAPLFAQIDINPPNYFILLPVIGFIAFISLSRHVFANPFGANTFLIIFFFIIFSIFFDISIAMTRGGVAALGKPFMRTSLEYYGDVQKVDNLHNFLKNYNSMYDSLSLHSRSHPPGPILLLWGVSKVFGQGVLKAALGVIIMGALSILPIYLLAKDLYGKEAAVIALSLYILSPDIILFTATCMNIIFALFSNLSVYFFFKSFSKDRILYSLLFGLSYALNLFMGFDTVILAIFFMLVSLYYLKTRNENTKIFSSLVSAALSFAVFYLIIYLLTDYSIFGTLKNVSQHTSRFYMEESGNYNQSYIFWRFGNIIAFSLFVGVPTASLYLKELYQLTKNIFQRMNTDIYMLAFIVTFLFIDLALMFFMGEVERLWLFLIPFLVIPAAKNLWNHCQSTKSSVLLHLTLTLLFMQSLLLELVLYTYW